MKRLRFAGLVAAVLAIPGICAGGALPAAAAGREIPIAIVTNLGTIEVALDPVHAPLSTANFLHYVDRKFFDGGSFFRAVPGFVIQGGNKNREQPGDPTVQLEPPSQTGLKNVDGAFAMARTQDPNSGASEFYICDGDQPNLDGGPGYAVFGHVTKNMALVRKIARLPASGQMLVQPVTILRIRRLH